MNASELVVHFENVSVTGGRSRYGDLELRLVLPPTLANTSSQLRATLTTPYEDVEREVRVEAASAAFVHVTVPTPPQYGVVSVAPADSNTTNQ